MDLRYPMQIELPTLRRETEAQRDAITAAIEALKAGDKEQALALLEGAVATEPATSAEG